MPEVLDLSTLKNKKPDLESLSEEQQAALEQMAEENPEPEGEQVRTAFLVVVGKDGNTVAIPDLDYAIIRDHMPSVDEIYSAVSVVAKDIQVQETAQITTQFMQQMAAAAQQQMQAQQLAQRLNLKK